MAEYAHPEVLVDTAWVAEHLNDPNVRIVESNEDILLYDQGHIPGAVKIDWVADLNDQVVRDYLDREHFEKLLSAKGIGNVVTALAAVPDVETWQTCSRAPACSARRQSRATMDSSAAAGQPV